MTVALIALVVGVILLSWCAERAIGSAELLSAHLGVSPIIVGALVIGLGTSLPEMIVSGIAAAQRDTIDLAVGNVVGSNSTNLTLVLGVGAAITTISGQGPVMRREGALMLLATAMFTAMAANGSLNDWEGAGLLVAMAVAAIVLAVGIGGKNVGASSENVAPGEIRTAIMWAIVGLAGVLIGAQLMVTGAVDLAREFGASEAFIGLTVVAFGTSVPELATAIASARRGSVDLVVGNVLGSNVFNCLAVGGIAGLVGDNAIEESITSSLWLMVVLSLALVLWGGAGRSLSRPVGVLLIGGYALVVAAGA